MSDLLERKGKVRLSADVITIQPDIVVKAFEGSIVVRAEMQWIDNSIEYVLLHPKFDMVNVGEVIPEYDIVIDTDDETGELVSIEYLRKEI